MSKSYVVQAVVHASEVLRAFQSKGEALRLRDLVERTGLGDGDGQFRLALERVRRHLRRTPTRRVLVGAVNDSSALGAARAFQEAGRAASCAIVGQNAEPDARRELRMPRTPLVGSVGYFPERYGEELIALALDILGERPAPPAKFVKHHVITPSNVDHYYSNDALLSPGLVSRPA